MGECGGGWEVWEWGNRVGINFNFHRDWWLSCVILLLGGKYLGRFGMFQTTYNTPAGKVELGPHFEPL